MIPIEKPGTPEELIHHGVKGMHWGVQRSVTGSSAFKGLSKVTNKNVQSHYARRSARTQRKKDKAKAIGVKNSYLQSVSSRAAQQRRVAEGKGSLGDKLKVGLTTSGLTVARAKKHGVSPAMERAMRSEAHIARMKNGEATAHDILRAAGSIKLSDIARARKKR